MSRSVFKHFFFGAFIPLLAALHPIDPLHGQESPAVRALKIPEEEAPQIDGTLSEPIWGRAPAAHGFRQRDPREGAAATEPTEVRILYDKEAMYFGIRCFDSQPSLIRATELRRDDPLDNDDTITILLDTFHDHRNANLFRTNPLGTKYDALITEEERDLNKQWDEIWWVETSIDEHGWVAEIKIPFKSLRSNQVQQQTWGLNLERIIRRKNELTYWSGYSRNWEFWTVSQAGNLTGLENVRTGLRLRVKPYFLGGFSQTREGGRTQFRNESQLGLEDVKLSLAPSVTADLTVYPDFAQTEVDEARVNLTRFTLFFPEKRHFFLEGAGIFRFGTPPARFEDIIPELLIFNSRRIGLSPDGDPIPIPVGGKVTGEHRGFQFGFIDIQTQDDAANFGIFRVKKNFLDRSYVGGIFTNKYVGQDGHYNRVLGLDANFVFFDRMTVSAMASRSSTRGLHDKDLAWLAVMRWTDHRFDVDLEHIRLDENFNPEIGFVRRGGVIRDRAMVAWKPRPSVSFIRQLYLATGHQWFEESHRGFLESRDNDYLAIVTFESGDSVGVEILNDYEFLDEPFAIHPEVSILEGSYRFTSADIFANAYPGRPVSGNFSVHTGEFYDGEIFSTSLGPLIKFNEKVSLKVEHNYNKVSLSSGDFTAQVLNSRFNYNFTNKLLTSTTARYDNVSKEFLLNFRLNYIYRPGDDLFVVYNESRDSRSVSRGLDRVILVKFNHSFDF